MRPSLARAIGRCALAGALVGCGSYFSPSPTPRRDAGSEATPAVHGCERDRFADRREPSAARVVSFGGAVGMAYSPPCIAVAPGQSVRFAGPLSLHPLRAGVVGATADGGAASPIRDTSAGDELTVTFPVAGDYPFHCGVHGTMGMAGVVQVR